MATQMVQAVYATGDRILLKGCLKHGVVTEIISSN
jgi:hypothetical protein